LPIPDPGSRISDPGSRIPDLGSWIPDPKTATKERDEKFHKFHKIENYFSFELQKKNMLANFQRILHPVELFTQKIVTML
jgi:hypothetical protein